MTWLDRLDNLYSRRPLCWFVDLFNGSKNVLTIPLGPLRQREARELLEIADLAEGIATPETIHQLRKRAEELKTR